ncbi:MAG: phosphopantetheine-binding protein, partial [Desulfobacterales bacterium]|nr:phosphopantetheine-binding protein [Desulfobacterales bacterium]
PVAPEHMARIRTLAQVAEHLRSSAPENRTQDAPPEKTEAAPNVPDSKIAETLTAVVSRLTGYPVEMLDPDMDMEADLGIDSIKRVEIFSALEEAIPGLPPVAPEHMARIRTLAQVAEHLRSSALENRTQD